MKTLNLYTFSELSDKAQRKAVNLAQLKGLFAPDWESDRHDASISFLAIVKELDFELSDNEGGISHHKYISDDIAGSKLKAMLRQDYGHIFPPKRHYLKSGKSRASKIQKSRYPEISGYWADGIILAPLVEFLQGYPGYAGYSMRMLIRDINAAHDKLIDDLWDYYTDHGVKQLLLESDDLWFTEEGILVKI